jgi:photosystem II stability/assembly factor-like uncharacterized protein
VQSVPEDVPPERQPRDTARKADAASKDLASERDRQLSSERRERVGNSAAPAVAPPPLAGPPPSSAAAEPSPSGLKESISTQAARFADTIEIDSLDVRRTDDGRVAWETRSDNISTRLTAGASPSPSVIWLVGKGGLELFSTDGRSWRRLRFPEAIDLTAIEASSDTTATVTAADGRRFTTSDGGTTWTPH